MTVKVPTTAAAVRAFFAANPEAVPADLSAEALHTLTSRGRLAPELIAAFNKTHRSNKYDPSERRGRFTLVPVPSVDKSGRVSVRQQALPADEVRTIARDLGLVGPASRGRFGKDADGISVLAHVGAALANL